MGLPVQQVVSDGPLDTEAWLVADFCAQHVHLRKRTRLVQPRAEARWMWSAVMVLTPFPYDSPVPVSPRATTSAAEARPVVYLVRRLPVLVRPELRLLGMSSAGVGQLPLFASLVAVAPPGRVLRGDPAFGVGSADHGGLAAQ